MLSPSRTSVLLMLVATHACGPRDFVCEDSQQCRLDDRQGVCEVDGYCSYADDECDSGRRYHATAPPGVAGTCVEVDAASDSGTADAGSDGPPADSDAGSDVGDSEDCTATELYRDADDDGFGLDQEVIRMCPPVEGYVEQAGDCNDDVAAINPTADEVCDEIDNDCDARIDEWSPSNGECSGCALGEHEGSSYWFCPEPLPWGDARNDCIARGGDLVVVESLAEHTYVAAELPIEDHWLGLHLLSDGSWVWTDGSAPDFEQWARGLPSTDGSGCGKFGADYDLQWADDWCDESPMAYVCEVE